MSVEVRQLKSALRAVARWTYEDSRRCWCVGPVTEYGSESHHSPACLEAARLLSADTTGTEHTESHERGA